MDWLSLLGPPRKDRFDQMPNMFPIETSGSGQAVNNQQAQAGQNNSAQAIMDMIKKFREQQELKRAQDAMSTPQSDPNASPWLKMA